MNTEQATNVILGVIADTIQNLKNENATLKAIWQSKDAELEKIKAECEKYKTMAETLQKDLEAVEKELAEYKNF